MSRKRVMITGASAGLGKAFARIVAERGDQVVGVARNGERLAALLEELPGEGHRSLVADLGAQEDLMRVCRELENEHFDLLINNAGRGLFGEFGKSSLGECQQLIKINCEALMSLCHAFLKNAQRGDQILNVASEAAFHAMPYHGLYAATKALVLSFSEALWYEQRKRGIEVMAVCPGYILTEFAQRAGVNDSKSSMRKFGNTPEEVAKDALDALDKGKVPNYIPGYQNKLLSLISKLLKRKWVTLGAGRAMEKFLNETNARPLVELKN